MPITLTKPSYAMACVGTQNGGDHDLIVHGKIIRRTSALVTIKVTSIWGVSGRDYSDFLAGSVIDLPAIITHFS